MKRKTLAKNVMRIPGMGVFMFVESLFRRPANSMEESKQVDDVLEHIRGSFFLIGGMTGSVTTASNCYDLLTRLGLHEYIVNTGTFIVTVLLFLIIDVSLKVISPHAMDYVCNKRENKRDIVVGYVLLSLVTAFGLTSMSFSYFGQDNTLAIGLGDKHEASASVAEMKRDDDKATLALLASLDKDIEKADKKDKEDLKALKGEWGLKVRKTKRRYRKLIKKGNDWAKLQVSNMEIDSAESISKFKPSVTKYIDKKNDILSKKEQSSKVAYESTGDENERLNEAHQNKKSNLGWLLIVIGCGATLFGILISLVESLKKDPLSQSSRSTTTKKKTRVVTPKAFVTQQVTEDDYGVTEIDMEVTGRVTEDIKEIISTPRLIKRIQQNGNFWKECRIGKRKNPMHYHAKMEADLVVLKSRISSEEFNTFLTKIHMTYGAQGFNV